MSINIFKTNNKLKIKMKIKTWIDKKGKELIISKMKIEKLEELIEAYSKSNDPLNQKFKEIFENELKKKKTF